MLIFGISFKCDINSILWKFQNPTCPTSRDIDDTFLAVMNVTVTNDERNCYRSTCRMNVTGLLMNVTVMDERNFGYAIKEGHCYLRLTASKCSKYFLRFLRIIVGYFFLVTSTPSIHPSPPPLTPHTHGISFFPQYPLYQKKSLYNLSRISFAHI